MTGAVTRQHPIVKRYRALARASAADNLDRELLLDGVHLLAEAVASGLSIESAAFHHDVLDNPETRALAEQLSSAGAEVLIVSGNVLDAMSPVKTPSGAVGIARRSMAALEDVFSIQPALIVLAHDIQDPGNVGALMRTGEAAGATAFVACGATADPFGWKALRGSMGSALRVPVARTPVEDALDRCEQHGVPVMALSARTPDSLFDANLRHPVAVLLGSEGSGLPAGVIMRAARRLSIPMRTPVESLNVAVAGALVLYEAYRQRQ